MITTRTLPSGADRRDYLAIYYLRQLVLGAEVRTRPYWSWDNHKVKALESLRIADLATFEEVPDPVPKYTYRIYRATPLALRQHAEVVAARRPIQALLPEDAGAATLALMRRRKREAGAPARRNFPAKSWIAAQVEKARTKPGFSETIDPDTCETLVSSAWLTHAYVAEFCRLNNLKEC
jgi:hypothetical protein